MADDEKLRSYLRRATTDLRQALGQLHDLEERAREPIAIVGMSCRFPGQVNSPDDLWRLVDNGVDAISTQPVDRGWDLDSLFDPDPDNPGTSYVREGGFLYNAGEFDAGFFGISPREALAMDPQQRLLLETAWEAFERAGLAGETLAGSDTGVFTGVSAHDYASRLEEVTSEIAGYIATGTAGSVASGRVSYTLGLEGPAMTVDTACSSSLVTIHMACQSLRQNECSLALAGGVTVMSTPGVFVEFSRQRGLASDGRCKPFAAAADGTGFAEGVGWVLLERLSDARRNGHKVLAVVRGSAVNQDGASNGLTAPNGPSQQRVIRQALANARLSAVDVDVVEAHGTGTTLGDPIEAQAVLATYGQGRAADRPLWLGSVKSNLGHTQAAAGVAGVIKMVLAMRNGVLPASLHIDEPTPHVDWDAGAVRLLKEQVPWPAVDRPRRAGVSAFGVSGTNAHLVLEQAPEPDTEDSGTPEPVGGVVPWVVTSQSAAGLRAQARRLADFAGRGATADEAGVGWSLVASRSVFEHRAVVLGADRAEFVAGLAALADGMPSAGVVTGENVTSGVGAASGAVLVFPGQGAQWLGMGVELLDVSPVFAARIAECEVALAPFVDWSLTDVLRGVAGAADITRVDVVQPVLWAVMVSLAAVWESFGVRPAAVVGHSQGEIAAAVVAGALSLGDGARVVAVRAQALRALSGGGAMASVAAGQVRVDALIDRLCVRPAGVGVAAVNGPSSTVISGPPGSVVAVVEAAVAEGVRARVIDVDYASHGPQVDQIVEELTARLGRVTPHAGRVAFYSAMTGGRLETSALDESYWVENMRRQVRFSDAVESVFADGYRVLVESSPHPVLSVGIQETGEALGIPSATVPTLLRDQGGAAQLARALGQAFAAGIAVDWKAWFTTTAATDPTADTTTAPALVELPTYAFQHEHYWLMPQTRSGVVATRDEVEERFWRAVQEGDLAGLGSELRLGDEETTQVLAPVLPVLAEWRRGSREQARIDGWRYEVEWAPVPVATEARLSGVWVLVVPEGFAQDPAVEMLTGALGDFGSRCVVVPLGTDQLGREAIAERLSGLEEWSGVTGVVSALALAEEALPGHDDVSVGLAGTLGLLQGLEDVGFGGRLWCVTRGGVSAGGVVVSAVQAAVWGLGRVAALEFPRRWGGLVDVPGVVDAHTGERLVGLLGGGVVEDQVALRGGGVLGRRLRRVSGGGLPSGSGVGSGWGVGGGSVLVTGGTGGVGGRVARWVVGLGAEHVVLASRRGVGASGVAGLVGELEGLGVSVDVVACDVGVRSEVEGLLGRVPVGLPLRGVFHAAGVGDFTPIGDVDVDRVGQVLGAKVGGARWLDELTRDIDLAAFVVFSSGAASWGSGQQGAYAAANAFVDALVERRRGEGLPGLSVAWGPWGEVGMAADEAVSAFFRERGLTSLPPDLALRAMHDALGRDDVTLTVADFDWQKFAATFTAQRPSALLADIPEAAQPTGGEREADEDSPLRRQLAAAAPAQRHQLLSQHVRALAASVLGHSGPDAIPAGRPFNEMGFDSLTAVELRNKLGAGIGFSLPTTVIFDYPTADQLAGYLLAGISGEEMSVAAPVAVVRDSDEPIVIVGMACRFPGGVNRPEQLWDLVAAGGDGLGEFPTDRGWDLDSLFDPDPDNSGTSYVREGGFLYGAGEFDAHFFGISPREAVAMDPQQRLLLETAWETLESAGIDPRSLHGTNTGVFTGIAAHDYLVLSSMAGSEIEGYVGTGNAGSVVSGRVSYTLGLEGPALTVDTGCSSSLVTMHMASQALRSGECSMALAGGVTVMATPGAFVEFSRQRGMASNGRCKPFAAAADGTGWSEGVGLVLMERLSDARRNGHKVLAVVRGSAVNQDGASNGLTAPNGPSQQRVIRQALANAQLTSADVDVVEAHGTGTTLGDPIEAQAVLATYGQGRPADRPLWLGSVKSNLGHTQAAAGVAGVIKMIMAMRNDVIPASLHIDEPTPHVDWTAGAVELLKELVPWPDVDRPRRAGVSGFGISGTNAHVIIEQAPPEPEAEERATPEPVGGVVPWVVSGQSEEGLRAQARRLADFVAEADEADGNVDALGVGWSLVASRSVFDRRAVVLGADRAELVAGLEALADGTPSANVVSGMGVGSSAVLVFPGQGAQWLGMGVELLDVSPVFAARIAECEVALAPFVDWSLTDVLRGVVGAADIARVDVVQPVLWAVMVSLAAVWESFGVRPAAVVGHSQGEIAAAVVAGALTLGDGARVVAVRAQALRALSGGGAMASVAAGRSRVEDLIAGLGERAAGAGVAAVNGPSSTVISGPPGSVVAVVEAAVAEGVRARVIDVDYASHGPQVDQIVDDLTARLGRVTPMVAEVAFYSAMTGGRLETSALDESYWVENMRRQVRFSDAVESVFADGYRVLVESSPHPVLSVGIQETGEELGIPSATVPTLLRDQGGATQLARALGQAFAAGIAVDWKAWFTTPATDPTTDPATDPAAAPALVELPTYAFQHEHYWPTLVRVQGDVSTAGMRPVEHGLLSAAIGTADGGLILTGRLPAGDRAGWLRDHEVGGAVLLPATVVMEWVLRAAEEVGCATVDELVLQTPVVLDEVDARRVQVTVATPGPDGRREVQVYTCSEDDDPDAADEWVCHAAGSISDQVTTATGLAGQWPPPGAEPLDMTGCYERAAAAGFRYGPAFQGLRAAWTDGRNVFADVALPHEAGGPAGEFGIHPALLDATLHPLLLLREGDGDSDRNGNGTGDSAGNGTGTRVGTGTGSATATGTGEADASPSTTRADSASSRDQVRLPFAWTGVSLHATGATNVRVRLSADDGTDGTTGQRLRMTVADAVGTPVLGVDAVVMRPVGGGQSLTGTARGMRGLYALDWVPRSDAGTDEAPAPDTDDWAVVGAELPPLEELALTRRYADLDALAAAVDAGTPAPSVVLTGMPAPVADTGDNTADSALAAVRRTLELAEDWLARRGLADARLAVVSRGAVPRPGARPRPDAAAVWGAILTLQGEHPGRFSLLDLDPDGERDKDTGLAEAVSCAEPEAALRAGQVLSPRLVRPGGGPGAAEADAVGHDDVAALDPDGTVLMAGGTGPLGGLIAEHLVRTGRTRHLLLVGPPAPGADGLVERLTAAGAEVAVVTADITDAAATEALVDGIDPRHPLTGVIHAMGAADDERGLDASWARAAGARNLHAATAGVPLGMFAVFSSAAAVLGDPGTPGDAAADAFCEALATDRAAQGLPGLSIGWGPWAGQDTPVGARSGRNGVRTLSERQLPALFEAAARQQDAHLVAVRVDTRALSARPVDALPAPLRALVSARATARVAAAVPPQAEWAGQLAGLPAVEQHRILLNLVRAQAAAVLGQSDPSRIEPERGFLEIGVDSLTAVELRNRLAAATGLRLPPTLIFDYASPDGLAGYLHTELAPKETDVLAPVLDEIDRLERSLLALGQDGTARAALATRLRLTTSRLDSLAAAPADDGPEQGAGRDRIQEASVEEIFAFIDRNLGRDAAK